MASFWIVTVQICLVHLAKSSESPVRLRIASSARQRTSAMLVAFDSEPAFCTCGKVDQMELVAKSGYAVLHPFLMHLRQWRC